MIVKNGICYPDDMAPALSVVGCAVLDDTHVRIRFNTGDIRVVDLVERRQFELSHLGEIIFGQFVNRSNPLILATDHIVAIDIHSLIGITTLLVIHSLQRTQIARVLRGQRQSEKESQKKTGDFFEHNIQWLND